MITEVNYENREVKLIFYTLEPSPANLPRLKYTYIKEALTKVDIVQSTNIIKKEYTIQNHFKKYIQIEFKVKFKEDEHIPIFIKLCNFINDTTRYVVLEYSTNWLGFKKTKKRAISQEEFDEQTIMIIDFIKSWIESTKNYLKYEDDYESLVISKIKELK